ncbi:hypothetical protein H0H93_016872 [Arthromyces matolae]|nr:hypothetical protein H0H93_016872 [Arthromyces matolae]
MDLVIVNNDPLNTLLTADSVGVRYAVSTPKTSQGQLGPTSIIRAEGESSTGHVDTLIGHFDLGPSRELKLQLCTTGSELVLHPIVSNGDLAMENSWTFLGPDRRSYKWQIFIQYPVVRFFLLLYLYQSRQLLFYDQFILDDNSNTRNVAERLPD